MYIYTYFHASLHEPVALMMSETAPEEKVLEIQVLQGIY